MPKVISKKPADKPDKYAPDFPLFPHDNGQWAKRIRGKQCHFGVWGDPDAALAKYERQRDNLYAGRTPRTTAEGFTVRDLANRFEQSKRHLRDIREITAARFGAVPVLKRAIEGLAKYRMPAPDKRPDTPLMNAFIKKGILLMTQRR